jgi:hypothetical protein
MSLNARGENNLLLLYDRLNPLQQSYRGQVDSMSLNARGEKNLVAIVRWVKFITAII